MAEQRVPFTVAFLLIGAYLCLMGNRNRRFTLFFVGLLTGFGFIIAILGEFVLDPFTDYTIVYVLLVIAALFGCLLGYLT